MERPVSYNIHPKKMEKDISMAEIPEGSMGEGFFATSLDKVIGLARRNSIWPLPVTPIMTGMGSLQEAWD